MAKTLLPRPKECEGKLKFWTKSELNHFFKCLNDFNNLKQLVYFKILAYTGMRKSEVLSLQWRDIDFLHHKIKITKTIGMDEHNNPYVSSTPKTKNSIRTITIDDETVFLIERWQKRQKSDCLTLGFNTANELQFLFTDNMNNIYRPQAPNDWLYNILKKYNLPKITLHGFRHTHASLLFESGANIKEVQECLGHKDVKTTMNIYTHVTPEKIKETGEHFANYVNF